MELGLVFVNVGLHQYNRCNLDKLSGLFKSPLYLGIYQVYMETVTESQQPGQNEVCTSAHASYKLHIYQIQSNIAVFSVQLSAKQGKKG